MSQTPWEGVKEETVSEHEPRNPHHTRREVLKKAAYVAPAILTLAATPSFASTGSGYHPPRSGGGRPPWAPGPPPWAKGKGPKNKS